MTSIIDNFKKPLINNTQFQTEKLSDVLNKKITEMVKYCKNYNYSKTKAVSYAKLKGFNEDELEKLEVLL